MDGLAVDAEGVWNEQVENFLATRYEAQSSEKKDRRLLRMAGRQIRALHAEGKVSTPNAKGLTEGDLVALYRFWKELGNTVATRSKRHEVLRKFLKSEAVCNLALERLIDKRHPVIPRRKKARGKNSGRPYTEAQARWIITTALNVAEDARTLEAVNVSGTFVLTMCYGLRALELRAPRMGEVADDYRHLDLVHFKGDDGQDANTLATLLPWMEDLAERYWALRRDVYTCLGLSDPDAPDIPVISKRNARAYGSSKKLAENCRDFCARRLKDKDGKVTRVAPRDGRTTYAVMLRDRNIPMDKRAVYLRHSDVATTFSFYTVLEPLRAKDDLWRDFAAGATTESGAVHKEKERAGGDSNPRPAD